MSTMIPAPRETKVPSVWGYSCRYCRRYSKACGRHEDLTIYPVAPERTDEDNFTIQWDLGDYPGFATEAEARAFQRTNRMTGSSIVPSEVA